MPGPTQVRAIHPLGAISNQEKQVGLGPEHPQQYPEPARREILRLVHQDGMVARRRELAAPNGFAHAERQILPVPLPYFLEHSLIPLEDPEDFLPSLSSEAVAGPRALGAQIIVPGGGFDVLLHPGDLFGDDLGGETALPARLANGRGDVLLPCRPPQYLPPIACLDEAVPAPLVEMSDLHPGRGSSEFTEPAAEEFREIAVIRQEQ